MLNLLQHELPYEGPRATDPEVLGKITVPVLLLTGQETLLHTWFTDAVQYIAQHIADPHVRELPGAGHFAPEVAPETLATELISFFGSVRQRA